MPTTADGIVYPTSGGHTRLWEHLQALAESVQARIDRPPLVFMGAGDLIPTRTSQNHRDTGGLWAMWECADAQNVGASNAMIVPAGWTNVAIDVYWTLISAGAGNVAWRGFRNSIADGQPLADGTLSVVTAAAPAVDVLKVTNLHAGTAVTPGQVLHVGAERRGTDALDTSAGLVGLIGIGIRPV